MVLVRVDVPVRPKNQSGSNVGPIAESSSAQAPLPQAAHGPTSQVEPCLAIYSVNNPRVMETQNDPKPYQTQLMLLEQQNKKRLLMARQEMDEERQRQDNNKQAKGSPEVNAASREDYHMQQMVLEQESGKTLVGARQRLAGHIPGASDSRNQGHDAHAMVGSYQERAHMKDSMLLEEQDKSRLGMAERPRYPDFYPEFSHDHGCIENGTGVDRWEQRRIGKSIIGHNLTDYEMQLMLLEQVNKKRLMQRRLEEDAAKQTTGSQPGSQNQAEDRWRKGPFPAGQGVISGYQAQLMALENQREEVVARSQNEVEFSEQREMSRLSGQQLPGAPGSSCAPPGTVDDRYFTSSSSES